MKFGITFTRRQSEWLGLDWKKTFHELDHTALSIIRLGIYWDEVEKEDGVYDFSLIKEELELASSMKKDVILTVGMKAPRWPEFYIPEFIQQKIKFKNDVSKNKLLREKSLAFIVKTIESLKDFSVIKYWQVENEPLDPQWPDNLFINIDFLQEEIDLVNNKSNKPILVNFWGNNLKNRDSIEYAFSLKNIDLLGFDFYPMQFNSKSILAKKYKGPDLNINKLANIFNKSRDLNISPVIAELQAEPWEEEFDYRNEPEKIKSISLDKIKENIESYRKLNPEFILLWGAEYWIYRGIEKDVVDLLK